MARFVAARPISSPITIDYGQSTLCFFLVTPCEQKRGTGFISTCTTGTKLICWPQVPTKQLRDQPCHTWSRIRWAGDRRHSNVRQQAFFFFLLGSSARHFFFTLSMWQSTSVSQSHCPFSNSHCVRHVNQIEFFIHKPRGTRINGDAQQRDTITVKRAPWHSTKQSSTRVRNGYCMEQQKKKKKVTSTVQKSCLFDLGCHNKNKIKTNCNFFIERSTEEYLEIFKEE